jgi:hypothetical protein
MIKYLLILAIVTYVFRKFIFMPIPGSQKSEELRQKKNESVEYTDYEEID